MGLESSRLLSPKVNTIFLAWTKTSKKTIDLNILIRYILLVVTQIRTTIEKRDRKSSPKRQIFTGKRIACRRNSSWDLFE